MELLFSGIMVVVGIFFAVAPDVLTGMMLESSFFSEKQFLASTPVIRFIGVIVLVVGVVMFKGGANS